MKALVYAGPHTLAVEERPTPRPQAGEVLIRVKYAGVCGSDLGSFKGLHPRVRPPVVFGHEFAGEVVAHGPDTDSSALPPGTAVTVEPTFACGTCEWCRNGQTNYCEHIGLWGVDADGAFAEYISVPATKVHKLPASASLVAGAMTEPLAVAVHAVRQAAMTTGRNILVIGAGPVGILTAMVAARRGARAVRIVEIGPYRAEMAKKLGLSVIEAPGKELGPGVIAEAFGGREPDITFEAAGTESSTALALRSTRKGGQVVMIGMPKEPPRVDLRSFCYRELHLIGCFIYLTADFKAAVGLLSEEGFSIDPLATDVVSLEDLPEMLEDMLKGRDCLKVLVRP